MSLPSNGQRRVALELISRLPELESIQPDASVASGMKGHAWEQTILPLLASGRPLWSPSTSGPLFYKRQLVTIHDVAFLDVPQFFGKKFALWYSLMVKQLASSCHHVATVSYFTRKRVIEEFGIPESKVTAIQLGVPAAFHIRSSTEVQSVLNKFNLETSPFLMGFSGTDPRKNTLCLVEAWVQSEAEKSGAKLVLYGRTGNSSVFSSSKATLAQKGIVRLGDVSDDDLACLFSACSGLVFPSLYEGFGLPVVEAASCGCRIATSNIASLPEVSPSDAILFCPTSVDEIGTAIKTLLSIGDSEEAKLLRAREMSRFSWDLAAAEYHRLFTELF